MKGSVQTVRWWARIIVVSLSVGLGLESAAWGANRWQLAPGSSVRIDGTSNVHSYRSRSTTVSAEVVLGPAAVNNTPAGQFQQALGNRRIQQLVATIPVQSLKSDKAKLDKKMYAALGTAPIVFRLSSYTVTSANTTAHTYVLRASGSLTVAGHAQPVSLTATATVTPQQLSLRGATHLRMTQFGITPPTALLGALITDDAITVHYQWTFTRKD